MRSPTPCYELLHMARGSGEGAWSASRMPFLSIITKRVLLEKSPKRHLSIHLQASTELRMVDYTARHSSTRPPLQLVKIIKGPKVRFGRRPVFHPDTIHLTCSRATLNPEANDMNSTAVVFAWPVCHYLGILSPHAFTGRWNPVILAMTYVYLPSISQCMMEIWVQGC